MSQFRAADAFLKAAELRRAADQARASTDYVFATELDRQADRMLQTARELTSRGYP